MPRTNYPQAGDLRAALLAAGLTVSTDLEGQLWSMAPAGVAAFERKVQRRMLAPATPTARLFDPPTGSDQLLFFRSDLASRDENGALLAPTVSYVPTGATPTAWAAPTNYLLEPQEADEDGKPWTRMRVYGYFWNSPMVWTLQRSISITGRWGYGCLLPDDAWLGCLNLGLSMAFGLSVYGQRAGLVRWTEAGVTEEYGRGLEDMWQSQINAAVAAYRRLDIG